MFVVMVDVVVDGVNQFHHIAKHATPQAVGGEVAEEALDHVQPRGAGGGEVDMKAPMTLQPALDGGMFVGRVVVHDQMQLLVIRCALVN